MIEQDCSDCNRSIAGSHTNNLGRDFLSYWGFPNLKLPGILAVMWAEEKQE